MTTNSNRKECVAEHAISSFPLPARYLSCCGKGNSRHRGVTPKRTPAGQYISVVKMLREALTSERNSASTSSDECEAYPSNSIEKKKKLKAQGAKTLTENDGPGEHENVEHLTVRPTKFVEDHFDDCGDDLSAITSATEKLFSSFEVFDAEVSTDCSSNSDESVDSLFDSSFMSFALPGSETTEEGNVLKERPCSTHFSDCFNAGLPWQTSWPRRHL
jgi:hypothetical protein